MSFALPTTITIVDKFPQQDSTPSTTFINQFPTLLDVIEKYQDFKDLVTIAQMTNLLKDPQANFTLFIPINLNFSKTTLEACIDNTSIEKKEVLSVDFELARKIVDSLIVPNILTTTIMIQSGLTRYKTRDLINTLTIGTQHCVQFEPYTFNKPPYGVTLNGKSKILFPDIKVSNGIVHTIDQFPYF